MDSYLQFLTSGDEIGLAFVGRYDPALVTLSVLTAIAASYMALHLSGRIRNSRTFGLKMAWLVPGALALGGGVWAMHFIGMLAFSLPCAVSYDPLVTLASMLPGMAAAAVALNIISQDDVKPGQLTIGGVLMGGGIGIMHYSGMAAMRMDAYLRYDPWLFLMSIIVAVILASISLKARFMARGLPGPSYKRQYTAVSATIMGSAIAGMHYTAMSAAYFLPAPEGTSGSGLGLSATMLAIAIGAATALLMGVAFLFSLLGRFWEANARLQAEIRKRTHAETQIRKLSRAVEQSPVSVIITDTDGAMQYVNPKLCAVTGYTEDELIGLNPRIFKSGHMSPEDYEELWATITAGREWRGEMLNKRKDESLYWDLTSISPIRDADGQITNFLGVKEDITGRKQSESELLHAKEEAEYASRAKSQFLANMSHELRTPLNAILGFSEMIRAEMFGPLGADKYKEYAIDITSSGRHLLEVITDILDVSKIESGTLQFSEEEIIPTRVAKSCIRLIHKRAEE